MSTTWNELHAAVQLLIGPGPQRERLAAAFTNHLQWLRPKDFPSEVRDRFVQLINVLYVNRIHESAGKDVGPIAASDGADMNAMSQTILELYDAVTRYEPIPVKENPPADQGPAKPGDEQA
ncbi:MAG: hypothetical protein JWQ21_990 [Herminiimonas sp.]|nr:hypothetical protein [Herminiimonas sp.]